MSLALLLRLNEDAERAEDDLMVEVTEATILASDTRVPPPMPDGVKPLGFRRCEGWALVLMLLTGGSDYDHSSAVGPSSLSGGPQLSSLRKALIDWTATILLRIVRRWKFGRASISFCTATERVPHG